MRSSEETATHYMMGGRRPAKTLGSPLVSPAAAGSMCRSIGADAYASLCRCLAARPEAANCGGESRRWRWVSDGFSQDETTHTASLVRSRTKTTSPRQNCKSRTLRRRQ